MSAPIQLAPCPFCGGVVHMLHDDHRAYVTCGQRDDGSDGCGLVSSFRPNLSGNAARAAWNRRASMFERGETVAWQIQLADALECFWNPAIEGSGSDRSNVIGGMVQGFAAVADRLREHAKSAPPATSGLVEALRRLIKAQAEFGASMCGRTEEAMWAAHESARTELGEYDARGGR